MLENLTGKARVWLRERKERAEEKRAERQKEVPYGASPLLWCWFITLVGVFALGGSTWMLAVFIAGSVGHVDWFSDYVATDAGVQRWEYSFAASVHWFNAIGLWLLCAAIGIFNAVWIELRKHFYGAFKNWITGLGLATAVFMVAGGVVVQQRGTDARTRDEVVAAQTAAANAGGIEAQIAAIDARLAQMRDRSRNNEYAATAANVGAAAYRAQYMNAEVLAREEPARRRIIERALGAAEAADALEADRMRLARQLGAARVQTVEAEATSVRADGWMSGVATFIEDLRKPVTSVLGELLAMSAFPMALAAWATRRRRTDVEASGWASEAERLEDLREQEPIPSGQFQMQTVMEEENVETGEKKRMITPKPYWRTVKKGKKQKIEVPPEFPADEVGVASDGGGRMASVAAEDRASDKPDDGEGQSNLKEYARDESAAVAEVHPIASQPSPEQDQPSETLPDLPEELTGSEQTDEQNDSEAEAEPEAAHIEADEEPHHQPRTEPETDETRLIAAE